MKYNGRDSLSDFWKQSNSYFHTISQKLITQKLLWTALLEIIVLSKHKKVLYMFWKNVGSELHFCVSNLLELAEIQ